MSGGGGGDYGGVKSVVRWKEQERGVRKEVVVDRMRND